MQHTQPPTPHNPSMQLTVTIVVVGPGPPVHSQFSGASLKDNEEADKINRIVVAFFGISPSARKGPFVRFPRGAAAASAS